MVVRERGEESRLEETVEMKEGKAGMGERRVSVVEAVGGVSELSLVRMTRERRFESKEAEMEWMRSLVRGMKWDWDWE